MGYQWYDMNAVKERWQCDEANMAGLIGSGLKEIPKHFIAIRRKGRWGVLYGEVMISDFQWLEVDLDNRLDYDHIMVRGESGWGMMDTLGTIIIDPVYQRLCPIKESYRDPMVLLASRGDANSDIPRTGLIDLNGNILAPCVHPYEDIVKNWFSYWEGDGIGDSNDYSHRILNAFAMADDPESFDTKYGLLNTISRVQNGKPWQLFPPQWDECEYLTTAFIDEGESKYSFGSPYARIEKTLFFLRVRDGDKWGIVDTAGRMITPCLWDEVKDDGIVRCGDEKRYIDLWSGMFCDEPVEREAAWTFKLPPEIGKNTWRTTMVYYRVPGLVIP